MDEEEDSIVDATIVRAASRCGRRKRGIECNALGRSRGGFSTKIHPLVNLSGLPVQLKLSPGQRHENQVAQDLLKHARSKFFIADNGYDSDELRKEKMKEVMYPYPNRKHKKPRLNRKVYAERIFVENFFHHLKRFRAIATRYEKTARNFLALVHLASTLIFFSAN